MSEKSGLSTVWIIGLYGLVLVAGLAVWRSHGEESSAADESTAVNASFPNQGTGSNTAEVVSPEPVEEALSEPEVAVPARSSREILQRRLVSTDEPQLFSKLDLPESDPAGDPAVRERQQRIELGIGASLAGLRPFDDDNPWNQRVDKAEVDPLSDALIRSIGADRPLHPCFGSGQWEGAAIGIPYVVVSSAQPMAPVEFTEYPDESDAGPYPIPTMSPIEGAPSETADRHVLVIDRDNWKLYELFHAFEVGGGWKAASGAIWDLKSNDGRPVGWTSADAAGLPVFPGLVRYDEVQSGEIRHALRFTVSRSRRAYVPPASHWASSNRSPLLPPMGMRVRLKQDFDTTKYPRDVQVILRCLQTYGMIVADNGTDWFITGAPDERWDNDALHLLKKVKGSDFEVIRMDGLVTE